MGARRQHCRIGYLEESLALARAERSQPWIIEDLNDLAFLAAETGDLDAARRLSAETETLIGGENVDQKIKVALVAAEIARLVGDHAGARSRMREALKLADSIGNLSFALRALRLYGQLLIDQGKIDEGLGVLALVLASTARTWDFTSRILDERVWRERTATASSERVRQAQSWARRHEVTDTLASILGSEA